MDGRADCFDLLDLAPAWQLDLPQLRTRFLARQEGASGEAEKRALNEAWASLRSPVLRAGALLLRLGREPKRDGTVPADTGFLATLMELRAELAEAQEPAQAEDILRRVQELEAQAGEAFAAAWTSADPDAGEAAYYRLQFLDRVAGACRERQDELQGL